MLEQFGKLLEVFPESKLSQQNPILRVYALEYSEPPALERPFPPETDVDVYLDAAREFARGDCAIELETAWDLWQFGKPPASEQGGEAGGEGGVTLGDITGEEIPDPDAVLAGADGEDGEAGEMQWHVAPATVRITCYGPDFDNDEGDHLRIDFGLDSQFLPQPGLQGSLNMQQSNLRSLLTLVGEITEALDLKSRQVWSESGMNFANVLAGAVEEFGPN